MSNRLSNPNIQFLDNSGRPLSGGSVAFYVTGTSTKTSTYSNSALSIANINPLDLDSAGRAGSVFLDPAVTYKLVLADANGSVIWTADPVVDMAANVLANVQVYAGNPNGNVAGSAGTPGVSGASMVYDITNKILYVCTTTGAAAAAVWSSASSSLTSNEDIRTTDHTVVLADAGRIQVANKATAITFPLTAAATIGTGSFFPMKNIGAGLLTIDPSGGELIEGAATFTLSQNQGALIYCTGGAWRVIAMYPANTFQSGVTVSGGALTLGAASTGLVVSSAANGVQVGSPTGGDKGVGSINLSGNLYFNGVLAPVTLLTSKVIASAAASLTTGLSPVTLFTVTGDVICRVYAVIPTHLTSTGNTGTLAVGVAGATGLFLVSQTVDGTAFPTDGVWGGSPSTIDVAHKGAGIQLGNSGTALTFFEAIVRNTPIICTIGTNSMTAGAITFYCEWRALSSGATVT